MAYNPNNPNGAAVTASSQPVNIASDQTVPVSLAAVPSHNVTNAGTFATQATLAAETTKVIGTVNVAAAQAITANAGTNLNTSALALDATLTGGTAQAKITDGTNISTVKAASTLPALTDKALVTTQRDPLPAGTNVIGHAIIDSGSTTAVTQATAANLNATVVGTGTFATQATQSGTWTVQPGNTANTTAWKVDGSAVTQPVSGTVTANAGTGTMAVSMATNTPVIATGTNTIGSVKLTDGTTVPVVKAASTAAVAADTALVVAISPNNTVPVSLASVPSHAVTNAGTFAVQSTPVTQADTFMLGGVNIKEINAVTPLMGNGVTGTGSQRVTIASDNTAFSVNAVQSGTWNVGTVTTLTGITNALPAGTNAIGNTGAIAVSTGGYSKVKYAAQTTTVQTVKGTQGKLGGYVIYNPNATVAYIQLFDVATGTTVTLGTTVPDVIIPIPATGGANLLDSTGIDFTNGIKLAATTTATGLTAPGTGLDMSIFYK